MRPKSSQYDILTKVLLIGDAGVGKSCLMMRFCDDIFAANYVSTVGVDFKLRTIEVDGKAVKLHVYDTGGQERYRAITPQYYRLSDAVILIFDILQRDTFKNVESWFDHVKKNSNKDMDMLLVGNKIDCHEQRKVSKEEALELASKLRIPYIEASAKSGTGVYEVFQSIARLWIQSSQKRPGVSTLEAHKSVELAKPTNVGSGNKNRSCSCSIL